jgi:hypothetical protein
VQRESQIPCASSKQIQPHEVPPLRPEYLPTPYTWKVWSDAQDPNNPYNLIDAAKQVQGADAPEAGDSVAAGSTTAGASGVAPVRTTGPLDLGLGDDELRSLFQIVELSQERTPVQFARNTADGRGVFRVALAHSSAFEERLREAWDSRGGLGDSRVLLFTALSKQPVDFHANFTFVQKHLSYQPDPASPRQLGILQGRLGALQSDELVLGYVVLPDAISLRAGMDVYWNDRRTRARFDGLDGRGGIDERAALGG